MPSATAKVTNTRIMVLEARWLFSAVTNWPLLAASCRRSARCWRIIARQGFRLKQLVGAAHRFR